MSHSDWIIVGWDEMKLHHSIHQSYPAPGRSRETGFLSPHKGEELMITSGWNDPSQKLKTSAYKHNEPTSAHRVNFWGRSHGHHRSMNGFPLKPCYTFQYMNVPWNATVWGHTTRSKPNACAQVHGEKHQGGLWISGLMLTTKSVYWGSS